MILFKAERRMIETILRLKKENGNYPKAVELSKEMGIPRSNVSSYSSRLKKYVSSSKKRGFPIEIKKEYIEFFSLPLEKQEKIIDNAMKLTVDK